MSSSPPLQARPPAQEDSDPPLRIGPYRLLGRLARGGMAKVYLAEGPDHERVALKVMSVTGEEEERRFDREGRFIESLAHPNIVRLEGRGIDQASGRAYLALELLPGMDLSRVLALRTGSKIDPGEACYILERCALGLKAVHDAGGLHRDIKPSNILLTADGAVKIADFGIALTGGASTRLTRDGQVVGTPHYMPPEVFYLEEWTAAGDVYSLGAVAYRTLSGKLLFPSTDAMEIAQLQATQTPPPLATLVPELPEPLTSLVDRMLSKQAAERPDLDEAAAVFAANATPDVAFERWRDLELEVTGTLPTELRINPNPFGDASRFHHFRIVREIARGGMGIVYEAEHLSLKKVVALKVMLAGALATEQERRRFLKEAEAAALLRHPNIVPVLDAGEHEGTYFITMEYVPGCSLTQHLVDHPEADMEGLLRMFIGVCEGVEHAHKQGIIHRDLKPDNVIVDPNGLPRVLDFGLAKIERDGRQSRSLTNEGDILGTLLYMPPEQASGRAQEVDARSDVYSLGAILYRVLTGTTPFWGSAQEILLHLIGGTEPAPPSKLRPSLPWELDAICLKALAHAPAERYASAGDLRDDLLRYLTQRPILARRPTAATRLLKWLSRHRRQVAVVSAALLLVAAWAFYGRWQRISHIERETLQGWRQFSAREYAEAARSFDLARSRLKARETLPLSVETRVLMPEELRGAEGIDRDGLTRWSQRATGLRQREDVNALLKGAREALDANRLGSASELIAKATLARPQDPDVLQLRSRVSRRLLVVASDLLERGQRLPTADLEGRQRSLDLAQVRLTAARGIDPQLAGLTKKLELLRAAKRRLERDVTRAKAVHHMRVRVTPAGGVPADGKARAQVFVYVRDAQGNPQAGQSVQLRVASPRAVLTQPKSPSDGRGLATGSVSSTVAGVTTLTVTINPGKDQIVLSQRPTVEFVAGPLDARVSTLELAGDPKKLVADGAATCALKVVLSDAHGNPIAGRKVKFTVTGRNNRIEQPASPTRPDGVAWAMLATTAAGTKSVSCIVDPGPRQLILRKRIRVRFPPGPVSASVSTLVVSPARGVVADRKGSASIVVTVKDAQGNTIPDQAVQLVVAGRGNVLRQEHARTNARGRVQAQLVSSVAERKAIKAIVNPGPQQQTLKRVGSATFVAGPVNITSCLVTADTKPIKADGKAQALVVVTVRDALGNPVSGLRVELSARGAGLKIQQPTKPSDKAGKAQGTIRATSAGTVDVSALVYTQAGARRLAKPVKLTFTR